MVETDDGLHVMQATNCESKEAIFLMIGINGQVLEVKRTDNSQILESRTGPTTSFLTTQRHQD